MGFQDFSLYSLFGDIYTALDSDLRVLAAIGIRTAFDRASELLGVDPSKTFDSKLSELMELGKIGQDQKETLSVLTDAGSTAAHRAWKPSPEELDTMLAIIEVFFFHSFVLPSHGMKLKKGVPPKIKPKKS